MKHTHFTDLCFFENRQINTFLDQIYSAVLEHFDDDNLPKICGSVAYMLHGLYSENYIPKDIDLEVDNWEVYRFLKYELPKMFPEFEFVEIKDERLILYTSEIVIEFWKPIKNHTITDFYKNKIKYTL
ncbi:MAG: hypothetical protein Q4A09_05000 [Capnocytophaga felis]|nr:hypothetical protein [Capnocytophaga felis]